MNVPVLLAGVVLGAAIVIVAWFVIERQRSARLRRRFGSEYEKVVRDTGSQRAAEAELHERERRVRGFEIRRLSVADRDRFANQWHEVQTRFVDEPGAAVADADRLVGELMTARGYPMADFEQRAADVSVDHPQVVDHYRTAHRIGGRRNGAATDTEELRQAMVHYRALFSDLLETDERDDGQRERRPSAGRVAPRSEGTGRTTQTTEPPTRKTDEPAEPARRTR